MICSYCSHIGGVMVTVLASSVVDHGYAGADPEGGPKIGKKYDFLA